MAYRPIYVLAMPDKAIVIRMFPPPCSTCIHYSRERLADAGSRERLADAGSRERCGAFGEPRPSVHARMLCCHGFVHSSVQRELSRKRD